MPYRHGLPPPPPPPPPLRAPAQQPSIPGSTAHPYHHPLPPQMLDRRHRHHRTANTPRNGSAVFKCCSVTQGLWRQPYRPEMCNTAVWPMVSPKWVSRLYPDSVGRPCSPEREPPSRIPPRVRCCWKELLYPGSRRAPRAAGQAGLPKLSDPVSVGAGSQNTLSAAPVPSATAQ